LHLHMFFPCSQGIVRSDKTHFAQIIKLSVLFSDSFHLNFFVFSPLALLFNQPQFCPTAT
jgi:hypothetical protein